MAEKTMVYSVLYLTPDVMQDYYARLYDGQDVRVNGYPLAHLMGSFIDMMADIDAETEAMHCMLCEERLGPACAAGCIAGLFDPCIAPEVGQEVTWMALCNRCHDKDPETAEQRLLLASESGTILDRREHPLPN